MSIVYDNIENVFYLHTVNTTYAFGILDKYLVHIYWGKSLKNIGTMDFALPYCSRSCSSYDNEATIDIQGDNLPLEFPTYGNTDLRMPIFHSQYEDGSTVSELRYVEHKIFKGKPKLDGLPSSFGCINEVETLEIHLRDDKTCLDAFLSYSVFEDKDVITRSEYYINNGESSIDIKRALSASVDFYGKDFDVLTLCGATIRERGVERKSLGYSDVNIESTRGASSHSRNPFIALLDKNTTEAHGNIYGMSFVYSGNFIAGASVDAYDMTRLYIGINPFDFNWKLDVNEKFTVPETVMVYSDCGIGGMSRIYHDFYRENLCHGKYALSPRPIAVNTWETVYFDFNENKIIDLAKKSKELGAELLVLDDGWFGRRNDDTSSLGDWYADIEKIPQGLGALSQKIEAIGLKFGLWVEPEMISPDSCLYRQHPEWCIGVKGRNQSLGRHQLILDFANDEVCDYIVNTMINIFKSAKISYVKWDMNRNMAEVGSGCLPPERQRETAHRYILGLYRVIDTLITEFPDILFESCSAGGGRFDAGMLYYMPQVWTSDNSDAGERMRIQYGTSIVYPSSTMAAHISAVPNHQIGRITSLKTRKNVAMMGQLGIEMNLDKITDDEKVVIANCLKQYKSVRETIHFGDMYRLSSPFDSNICSVEFVSKDSNQVVVFVGNMLAEANGPFHKIRLEGLVRDSLYKDKEHNISLSGASLMQIGITLKNENDFDSDIYVFERQ